MTSDLCAVIGPGLIPMRLQTACLSSKLEEPCHPHLSPLMRGVIFPGSHCPKISCFLLFHHHPLWSWRLGNHVCHVSLDLLVPRTDKRSVIKEEMGDQMLGRQSMMSAKKKKRKKESLMHTSLGPHGPFHLPPCQASCPCRGCAKSEGGDLLSDTNMEALVPEEDSLLQRTHSQYSRLRSSKPKSFYLEAETALKYLEQKHLPVMCFWGYSHSRPVPHAVNSPAGPFPTALQGPL